MYPKKNRSKLHTNFTTDISAHITNNFISDRSHRNDTDQGVKLR